LEDFPTAEFDALFGLDPRTAGGRGQRPSGRVLPLLKRRRLMGGADGAEQDAAAAPPSTAAGGDGTDAPPATVVSDDDSPAAAAAAAGADGGDPQQLLAGILDVSAFSASTATSTSTTAAANPSLTTPQLSALLDRTYAALSAVQRQLHRGEELYGADTDARGNLYKGWDAILDARSEDVGAGERDFGWGGGGGGGGQDEYGSHLGGGGGFGSPGGGGPGPTRRMPLDHRWFSGSCPTFAVGGAGGRNKKFGVGGSGSRPSSAAAGAVGGGPPILPTPQGPKTNVNVTVKGQLTTPQPSSAAETAAAAVATTRPVGPAAVPKGLVPGEGPADDSPPPDDVDMEDADDDEDDDDEADAPAARRGSSRKSTRKRTRG